MIPLSLSEIEILKRELEDTQNQKVLLQVALDMKNTGLLLQPFIIFLDVIDLASKIEHLTRDKKLLEGSLGDMNRMYEAVSAEYLALKEKLHGAKKCLTEEL